MTEVLLESPSDLHLRIWHEFQAMPGLRLTPDQTCRLIGGKRSDVLAALNDLVEAGILRLIGPYYIRADFTRYTA